jgi:phosphoribosylformimino-5-aminoimidazole carboxamide ribotide isomerase
MAEHDIRNVRLEDIWRIRREVMYPDETIAFVQLEEDEKGIHLGLYESGEIVSVISLFPQNDSLQFRKFATLTAKQGKGYGTQLLAHIMDWACENGYQSIWCNARLSATRLYEKFGMSAVGNSWEKWGIAFIKMEKSLTHGDHSRN